MMLRRTTIIATGLSVALLSATAAWSQVSYAPSSLNARPGPAWNMPAPQMAMPGQMPYAPYGVMPVAYQPPMGDAGTIPTPMPMGPMPGGPMPMGPMPSPEQGPMSSVMAPPGAMPPPGAMMGDPNGYGAPPYSGEYGGDGSCGPEGGECGEFDSGFKNMLFPTDRCPPRWYNIDAELMLLKRETGGGTAPFASEGIGGPIVLSADQFEFTEEPGVKVSWQSVIGAADAMEVTYMGTFFWADSAEATSATNNLFTAFSDFGQAPFGGFSDTDAASLLRTTYESDLNSLELNYRYRWVSPNNRINHSLLLGVRWVRLGEQFRFQGQTLTGSFDNRTDTINNDVGGQVGFDLWVNVFRRLVMGGGVKVGLYGNDAIQRTSISATTVNPDFFEEEHRTVASFVTEANFMVVGRVTDHLSIKGGYELMYLDRVALATNNFNSEPIFLGARTPFLNTAGEVFYHGFTGGFEWTW